MPKNPETIISNCYKGLLWWTSGHQRIESVLSSSSTSSGLPVASHWIWLWGVWGRYVRCSFSHLTPNALILLLICLLGQLTTNQTDSRNPISLYPSYLICPVCYGRALTASSTSQWWSILSLWILFIQIIANYVKNAHGLGYTILGDDKG